MREAFRDALPYAERGDWRPAEQQSAILENYVLWPDLRATYFRARLDNADHGEIGAFLERFGSLKPARELRYLFALHLANADHTDEFLELYRRYYEDLDIARLDCMALAAELQGTAATADLAPRAIELWLIGSSQADECNPVFDHLRGTGALGTDEYRQRYTLALEERQFSLARYLARGVDETTLEEATRWVDAANDPTGLLDDHAALGGTETGRQQLAYALERLTYREPLTASNRWRDVRGRYPFADDDANFIERHIALWAARRHLDEGADLLHGLPPPAIDTEVRRWRIRTALRRQDWDTVLREVAALPAEEQTKEEWRYWEAIALGHEGQQAPAELRLQTLAAERSYYGFLAADEVAEDYAFADSRLEVDPAMAAALASDPAIVRARELFLVGIEGRGRSEWDAAIDTMTPPQQAQAALLAHDWGWHSRAIATASSVGEFDDLDIRYPLPWRDEFTRHASAAGISDSWAYGVARSESLFMRDIRSSAGAIGLMQLMPTTGRRVAGRLKHPYNGLATLTDSSSNIRLGTSYLASMAGRYGEHRVLATAAYNAGPLNVDAWLPASPVDARVWIENIPFNETRGYVRRVLTADAIFHWRMTGNTKRIKDALVDIAPAPGRVAANP